MGPWTDHVVAEHLMRTQLARAYAVDVWATSTTCWTNGPITIRRSGGGRRLFGGALVGSQSGCVPLGRQPPDRGDERVPAAPQSLAQQVGRAVGCSAGQEPVGGIAEFGQ
ncbi:hypothetical protein OG883_46110 [Streptomyces sp. NBC_01142]|uniref:hypothetical protein n=1 Tax=Streptomyces sp. NBC_01142 TaxID=2975865 RepID=UPI002255AC59|nr:hypothetical protein [Streptomyces sp. NBC_01142]MCX4827015.1 hypothetical protein [Streptomyces sp. NBC_01142]